LSISRANVPSNEVISFFNNRLEALLRWQVELGDIFFVANQMCFLFQPDHVRVAFASENSLRVYDSLGRKWPEASASGWKQFRLETSKHLLNTDEITEIATHETQQVKEGTHNIVELMLDLTSRTMCAYVLGTSQPDVTRTLQRNIKAVLRKHATWFDLPLFFPTPVNLHVRHAIRKAKQSIKTVLKQADYSGVPIRTRYGNFSNVEVTRSLLAAGSLPPATVLAWFWYLLEQHPDHSERLYKEVDQGRHELLDAALKETLRIYPPISFLLTTSKNALTLNETVIPANTLVAFSPYCIHRDARFWEDPLAFRPERWFDQTKNPAYLPFGVGMHSCMATALAYAMMSALVAGITKRFHLRATARSDLTYQRSSILMPKFLEMEVVKR
jgi:cytochrome P450